MKKLFLVLAVLTVAAGFTFAQAAEPAATEPELAKPEFFDLEISVGVPVHWTNSPRPHWEVNIDKTVTASTSIGVSTLWNFNRVIGLTLDMDAFIGSDVMGMSGNDSYSDTLFGFNVLLGPVFYLFNDDFLRIPLAVGAHIYYWSSDHWELNTTNDDGWVAVSDFQFGPGAYLGIQFHFDESIYIFSRTNIALTFVRWHEATSGGGTYNTAYNKNEWDTPAFNWHVKPTIGVGVKF